MKTTLVVPARWLLVVVVTFSLLGFTIAPPPAAVAAQAQDLTSQTAPGLNALAGSPAGETPSAVDSCGYPYSSSNPLTNIVFNESEVLRAFGPVDGGVAQPGDTLKVWYNDEHALTLGVRQVQVKTSSGTTSTDYPVTPLTTNPGSAFNPQVGVTSLSGDQAGADLSDRPMWPAIFITDLTADPDNRAGDWQFGGTGFAPHAVFGTWKSAVRLVDKTHSPAAITVMPDADPAKNDWNLNGGDPAPAGLKNEGYGAEVRWDVDRLVTEGLLIPGHTYRFQFMVHDGDQNKSGGDVGEACTTISIQKPPADLKLSKTLLSTPPLYAGTDVTYSIRITDTGPTAITFLPLRDWYDPSVLEFVDATPPPSTVVGGMLAWNDLVANLGILIPNQAITVLVRFRALRATLGATLAAAEADALAPPARGASLAAAQQARSITAASSIASISALDSCGYPYASSNPLTSIVFNESEVLRGFGPVNGGVVRPGETLKVWFNDEHALTLGVRQVQVKTASGTTSTNYAVTPLTTNPGSAFNPQVGSASLSGDQAGTDISNRPMWPVIFITDVTTDPNNRAGDWQWGGVALTPHAIFGTWKGAVRLVDKTRSPAVVSVTPDADPAKNDWNLDGGDPAPAGLTNEGYGAEARWDVNALISGGQLIPGHTYRFQFMVHDGDQNKSGGDVGEACTTVSLAPSGSIGDRVWYDANGDKLQQATESGLNGVEVDLYGGACPATGRPTGTPQRTFVTAGDGNYDFATVAAGTYCVAVNPSTLPTGFALTTANEPLTVVLANNQDYNDADFGYRAQCPDGTANLAVVSGAADLYDTVVADRRDFVCATIQYGGRIGDRVWNDANGNGVQDAYTLPGGSPQLEPGIAGAVVGLTRPGGSVITTTTTITGYYQFTGLTSGQYSADVIRVPAGYFTTTNNHPQPVSLAAGQSFQDADFGYAGKGLISGVVFYDWDRDGAQGPTEAGIANVPVCLYKDSNRNGVLDAPDTLVSCQNSGDQGEYAFTNQLAGAYIVKETPPSNLQNTTPTLIPVSLVVVGSSGIAADNNYGHVLFAKLGDFAYLDLNANGQQDPLETTGLAGVPLKLTGTNVRGESVNWTGVTLGSGAYLVDGLLPGTYMVTAPLTFNGFQLTSPSVRATTLDITKPEDLTLDFGYIYPTAVNVEQFGVVAGRGRVELSWLGLGEPAPFFYVWRADNGKGIGAVQVTAEPVIGVSGVYRYADTGVAVGQSYWYWLEDAAGGQRFGPQTVTVRPMGNGIYLPLLLGR